MPAGKPVRLPEPILAWFETAVREENVLRDLVGLPSLSGPDLIREVLARFAGIPTERIVDLGAVRARRGVSADMWTPPHGGKTKTRRTAHGSDIRDPPNPPIDDARKGSTS